MRQLPFQFLVSNAAGQLRKADFSRKAYMPEQELHFLRKFEVIASTSLPSHQLYGEKVGDKSVMELETQLEDVRKRIQDLEVDIARSRSSSRSPSKRRQKIRPFKLNLPVKREQQPLERFEVLTEESDYSDTSESDGGKAEELQTAGDQSPLASSRSEASSLRSKLAESLKVLSPNYSPRRLERSLKAAAKGSCLDQEASLAGEEWLDLKLEGNGETSMTDESPDEFKEDFKSRAIPVKKITPTVGTTGRTRQVRIRESTEDLKANGDVQQRNGSNGGPVMKSVYKQFLGAGSAVKPVEEFRETLRTLENLELEKKEAAAEDYTKQKIAAYQRKDAKSQSAKTSSTRTEDVDTLKNFIASGWNLLTEEAKRDKASSSNLLDTRQKNGTVKERIEERKSPNKVVGMEARSRQGTDDEGQQMKALFRDRLDGLRRKSSEQANVLNVKIRLKDDASDLDSSRVSQQKHVRMVDAADLETLRKELETRFADVEIWRKQQSQEIELLIAEKAGNLVSQQFSSVLSEMKNELSLVREEIRSVEKWRDNLQKEHECLRYESGRMRMELQNAREGALQSKMQAENLKKENGLKVKVEDCYQRISKLSEEASDIKAEIKELKAMGIDKQGMKRLAEILNADGIATKGDLKTFKEEQETICGRILIEGEKEKAVIMDRVEHLSQLYLGGLEDVKSEVSNLKLSLDSTSSARSESLFGEMRRRSKKCVQLETLMRDKIEAAAKLQEKYTMDLENAKENWNWALNVQIGEAKTTFANLAEEKRGQLGSKYEATRLEQAALLNRIQGMEDKILELSGTVQSTGDPLIFANIERHQEVIQSELQRLDDQMRDTLRRLENMDSNLVDQRLASLRSELDTLGQKVRDATKSRTVILDKMSEMGKKIRKLEGAQVEFIRSIEEVRASTSDLEKSSSTWFPKYETAAGHLKDMDARLVAAENFIQEFSSGQSDNKESAEVGDIACVELLHTRVETLEGRVEHVASATITNLRILDSKVEHYRVGVQSAIEGAAMAESKCGVLGAELVKVFRMLAARNGKLNEHMTGGNSPILKTDCPKHKARGTCKYCKKQQGKGSPEGGEETENSFPPYDDCCDNPDNREHTAGQMVNGKAKGRNNESLSFIESYAESFYESGQNFKKNLTSANGLRMPAAEKFGKKKEHKANCKSCQRTNIRLEAGKIHVNVCHRVADANRNRPDDVLLQPQKPLY